MKDVPDANQIDPKMILRAKLLAAGFSVSEFARVKGYNIQTVDKVMARYARGVYKSQRGTITHRILNDLQKVIGPLDVDQQHGS